MEPKDLLPQLREISANLESRFQDACDFEFTVQDGKVYVLNARIAKRTPAAALRIATDLFLEGKITGKDLIARIDPTTVEAILKPTVIVNSKVRELGRGLPASPGAETGMAAFSADSVVRLRSRGVPAVFLCSEMTPEDIHGVDASVGVISFRGGMTSHAAVCCRGMQKPCVSSVQWSFDRASKTITTPRGKVLEGDPLTLDGTSGIVYAGKADVKTPSVLQNDRLLLILRLIDALSAENELPRDKVGRVWLARDIMKHGSGGFHPQSPTHRVRRWPASGKQRSKAFVPLRTDQLRQLSEATLPFSLGNSQRDYIDIWRGFRACLLRLLSRTVGIGRHPEFVRPLFDPSQAVLGGTSALPWKCRTGHRIQIVGEEFFSINYHVPELIDIATIRLYWVVECENPAELWRVERTNPAGEKLVEGSARVSAVKIMVNDAVVPQPLLPNVYNSLRRREYFWSRYDENNTSRHEIVDAMMNGRAFRQPVRELAMSCGLISPTGAITSVGKSLLDPSSASERARLPMRIGW
jgi:phosphohistidine swiveling domain-containing protein